MTLTKEQVSNANRERIDKANEEKADKFLAVKNTGEAEALMRFSIRIDRAQTHSSTGRCISVQQTMP